MSGVVLLMNFSCLEAYAITFILCISTAPNPFMDASQYTTKSSLPSGSAKIGVYENVVDEHNHKLIQVWLAHTVHEVHEHRRKGNGLKDKKKQKTKSNNRHKTNERGQDKSGETTKDQSRINPTQQERKSKTQDKVKGLKVTSLQSLKGHLKF
ncbi:hypothetical protein Tco_1013404 [Tanacetum coccineum]